MYLSEFQVLAPPFTIGQTKSLEWLAEAYQRYQKTKAHAVSDYLKLLGRVGCSPHQIDRRSHYLPDFQSPIDQALIFKETQIERTTVRQDFFQTTSQQIFEDIYGESGERSLPAQLIHVTCTGYASPSGAQLIAARLNPETVVTHSYHMGCYGAFPALRMASGFLASPQLAVSTGERTPGRKDIEAAECAVDIVHTELCTLQMLPVDPTLEQMVIQSLFADGMAVYRATTSRPPRPALEVLHLSEFIIPESDQAMAWAIGEHAMSMTLSKDVPKLVASALRAILLRWEKQSGRDIVRHLSRAIVAVHPGGPKIIDAVRDLLELRESQVAHSRAVLFEHGNMSSATVPHIWKKIIEDPAVVDETPVLSLAFGPGLTVCLSWMRVCR